MDAHILKAFEVEYTHTVTKAKATAFESFGIAVLQRRFPDFKAVKACGRGGDGKADGYCTASRTVFQFSAPEKNTDQADRRVASKIKQDFEGARQFWGELMQHWIFVHNDIALGPRARKAIEEIRRDNADVTIDDWDIGRLWAEQVSQLPEADLRSLLLHDAPAGLHATAISPNLTPEQMAGAQRLNDGVLRAIQTFLVTAALAAPLTLAQRLFLHEQFPLNQLRGLGWLPSFVVCSRWGVVLACLLAAWPLQDRLWRLSAHLTTAAARRCYQRVGFPGPAAWRGIAAHGFFFLLLVTCGLSTFVCVPAMSFGQAMLAPFGATAVIASLASQDRHHG